MRRNLNVRKNYRNSCRTANAAYVVTEFFHIPGQQIKVRQILFHCSDLKKSREEAYLWHNHRHKLLNDSGQNPPKASALRYECLKDTHWRIELSLVFFNNEEDIEKDDLTWLEKCDTFLLEGDVQEKVRRGRLLERKIFKKRFGIFKLYYWESFNYRTEANESSFCETNINAMK